MTDKNENTRLQKFEEDMIKAVQECIDLSSNYPDVGLFVCPDDLDVLAVPRPGAEGEGLFAYDFVEWRELVINNRPDVVAITQRVKDIASEL